MKIACVGTQPASVRLAPFGDTSWEIWGCSPGLYPLASRTSAWFELHRWEPPVLGDPSKQVPWFTPEYCGWMAQRPHVVWMREQVPAIPNSRKLPWEDLVKKYGHFFFTSSLAWMAAMAIEAILINRDLIVKGDPRAMPPREGEGDCLGFWGVDMSTDEEYVMQRSGCQFFATIAASMGIEVVTPPESDLMMPPALYGIAEGWPRQIKLLTRINAHKQRIAEFDQQIRHLEKMKSGFEGALEADTYHLRTWTHEGSYSGTRFEDIFAKPAIPAETGEGKPQA